MNYIEIAVTTTSEASELIADVMFSLGAGGVSVDDRKDVDEVLHSDVIWDYVDDSLLSGDDKVVVRTVIAEEEQAAFIADLVDDLSALSERAECELGELTVTTTKSPEVDWQNEWKKHFKPINTPKITVVPSWQEYTAADGEKTLLMEAGAAFGTGEHETTRMCLTLIPDVADKTVLDVGCGSGILAIAAKLLGAKSVYGCDIDSNAIAAARGNADMNGVEITVEKADLLSAPVGKADVIFANITADILIRLSKDILNHSEKDVKVVLSGIIHARLADVQSAYEQAGYRVDKHLVDGEWDALLLSLAE